MYTVSKIVFWTILIIWSISSLIIMYASLQSHHKAKQLDRLYLECEKDLDSKREKEWWPYSEETFVITTYEKIEKASLILNGSEITLPIANGTTQLIVLRYKEIE